MIDDFKPRRRVRVMPAETKKPETVTEEKPTEPVFKTPEETADEDPNNNSKRSENSSKGPDLKDKFAWLKRITKKQWIIIGVVLTLLVGGGVAFALTRPDPPAPEPEPAPVVEKEEKPEPPKTLASPLTGVQVKPELAKLPTTGVMIENSPDARPQSGLYHAGVVVEAIAEGGITRFLALFQESQPDYIGPVRSVRPYFLDFLVPFDAPIAHVGGSAQALAEIRNQGIKDLDQFFNPGPYHRVSSRFAPHNMYTSRSGLLELQKSKGWGTSKFSSLVRKAEKKAKTPNASAVDVNISSFTYNPRFVYNAKSNSYLRHLAGAPHMDEKAGKQLNPKTVVVLVMPHHYSGIYSVYQTTGSGKAFIFQDGTVTEGIWEKKSRSSQLKLGDANGSPLGLNPGQTWITLVGDASRVIVTP